MNEKLQHISEFLPTLRELFDDDVFFTVVDTDMVVQGFSLPKGVVPTLHIGDVMQDPTGASQSVMRSNRPMRNMLPKDVYGAAYEGILAPITDKGSVIGCMICTHSVEIKEQNAEIAARFRSDVSVMSSDVGNIASGINDMTTLLSKMGEVIDKIENDVKAAKDVTAGINKNADTSNILAINASIEAARAGAAGKGFAIVAGEMGKLANASKKSADTIRSTLDLIVEHLTFIVSSIRDANGLADTNMEKVELIKNTLSETLELSEKLEQNIKS